MKHIFSFCLIFSIFQLNAQDGLVAHFPFNECNFEEFTGVSPTTFPVPFDAEDIRCDCGVRDTALVLAGSNDINTSERLLLFGNYHNYFDTDDFAVSLNFRPTSYLGQQILYSKRDSCTDERGIFLKFAAATNSVTAFVGENSSKKVTLFGQLPSDRCWYHVVLVRNLNKVQLYANGELIAEQSTVSIIDCKNDAEFQIGFDPCLGTTDFGFTGLIDDIRVYNRALKSEEIRDLNVPVDFIGNKRDTIIIEGSAVDIFTNLDQTCANQLTWSPIDPFWGVADINDPNTRITPPETQTYELAFTYEDNSIVCTATDTIRIQVVDPNDLDCSEIFLPKAFTPNGDGLNDTYGINNPFAIVNFGSFEILDRWGGRVFYTEDAFGQWDGTHNGQKVNPGVCLYRIRYTCQGEEKIILGSLTVIR